MRQTSNKVIPVRKDVLAKDIIKSIRAVAINLLTCSKHCSVSQEDLKYSKVRDIRTNYRASLKLLAECKNWIQATPKLQVDSDKGALILAGLLISFPI